MPSIDTNPYLDYNDAQAGDTSEQLYQYYLRSQIPPAYEGYADSSLTIPTEAYQNSLNTAINDRTGGPYFYNSQMKADKSPYNDQVSWTEPNPSLAIRNADHGLQSQIDWSRYGPLIVPRAVLYNALKWLAQNMPPMSGIPGGLDALGESRVGQRILGLSEERPFTDASPPSWESLKWGMRPLWGRN